MVPESTACLLKKQYLAELKNRHHNSATIPRLPTKPRGHPLLLGSTLDDQVKEYVTAAVGVVNIAIMLAAAEGIVAATERSLLRIPIDYKGISL